MSVLLYVAGAIAVALGAAMIGYGVPINEFSFGNTLIIAGTVAVTGGMIVLALAIVVGRLQDLADVYARGPARPVKLPAVAEVPPLPPRAPPPPTPPLPASERVPFPAKPKAAARVEAPPREHLDSEPREFAMPPLTAAPSFTLPPLTSPPKGDVLSTPFLPNPDERPAFDDTAEEVQAVNQAPQEPEESQEAQQAPEPEEPQEQDVPEEAADEPAAPIAPARRAVLEKSEPSYFDAMWPADPDREPKARDTRLPEPEPADDAFDPKALDPRAFEPKAFEPKPFEPNAFDTPERAPVEPRFEPAPPSREERPAVAILKSGVVDGMGYTLYVDGSIEAELPQGTLRFASINELRAHLEKAP